MEYHAERREFFKLFCFSYIFVVIGVIFDELLRLL